MICIIPARLHSTRLNKKLITCIKNKPLICYTYENIVNSTLFDDVYVASDSKEILNLLPKKSRILTNQCSNGTQRVFDACKILSLNDNDIVCNVQGDYPNISHSDLQTFVDDKKIIENVKKLVLTAYINIKNIEQCFNTNIVKVAVEQQKCLYFSRQNISFYKHIGIYGYSFLTLKIYNELPVGYYEAFENLEQLRSLLTFDYYGVEFYNDVIGIDTAQHLLNFREFLDDNS